MEYGFSILMFIFSGILLLYAGLMALTKNYDMLPVRARVSVKPKDKRAYAVQLAKVIALVAAAPGGRCCLRRNLRHRKFQGSGALRLEGVPAARCVQRRSERDEPQYPANQQGRCFRPGPVQQALCHRQLRGPIYHLDAAHARLWDTGIVKDSPLLYAYGDFAPCADEHCKL